MKEEKSVLSEIQEGFQAIVRGMAEQGITESVFVVHEGQLEILKHDFLEGYKIATTAKLATYNTFEKESYVKSFRYMGHTIHFKVLK